MNKLFKVEYTIKNEGISYMTETYINESGLRCRRFNGLYNIFVFAKDKKSTINKIKQYYKKENKKVDFIKTSEVEFII